MVKRLTVGAHYGFRDWLAQRVTAVIMALYTVLLVICLFSLPDYSLESWRALFSGGLMKFATFLFFLALFYHAWVGIRDIWMDYVKPAAVRLVLHVFTMVWLLSCLGWAVQVLWRL